MIESEDTQFLIAAEDGFTNTVKDLMNLINKGANVNSFHYWNNYTALHYASANGWCASVQFLLEKGADIHLKTKRGETPLLLAAENGHKRIAELLLKAGAEINCSSMSNSYTLLHHASRHGWLRIVKSLLKKGACVQFQTKLVDSPLLLAAENGWKDIVKLLIKEGAEVNCSFNWYCYTVLHFAASSGWVEIIESLLEKGVNINAKSSRGETALQLAIGKGNVQIVEHLITAGADVKEESNDGSSPMSNLLIVSPEVKLIKSLIYNGAFLKPADCEKMRRKPSLQEEILRDVNLCSQAVANKFNYKDLCELYKLAMPYKTLPNIESMRIKNCSTAAQDVLEGVQSHMKLFGHCNVTEVETRCLKMMCVKSFLGHCEDIKKQERALNQAKRSVEFQSSENPSKVMRCD